MSGFAVRVGAVVLACALVVPGATSYGDSPPAAGLAAPLADAPGVFSPTPLRMGQSRGRDNDRPRAVPLPPGVYVGLFGLASAAIARRRYLKRH
jgi:hypothetical protein